MSRSIETKKYTLSYQNDITDPVAEINNQAKLNRYQYLLVHASDGVIWGIVKDGALELSSAAFPEISPVLRNETLHEARLFGQDAEWFLWRSENGWRSRAIIEGQGKQSDCFSESLLLWGTNVGKQDTKDGFYLAEEADLGIRHTPPKALTERHSLRLLVRHYLDYDDEGAVYVKLSRLVNLKNNGGEK